MDDNQPLFFDTNMLLQLHIYNAQKHEQVSKAITSIRKRYSPIWISRQVIREYISVITRPTTNYPMLAFWEVDQHLNDFESSYRIADETKEVTTKLRSLLRSVRASGKQIHDANIVATMMVYGVKDLYTLNVSDFTRFSEYITIHTLTEDEKKEES